MKNNRSQDRLNDESPMNSKERVYRALEFQSPDRPPRDLWRLPGVDQSHADEVRDVLKRYPLDFTRPPFQYGKGRLEQGEQNRIGGYTDAWGCGWEVGEDGVIGEVKRPPLADWKALDQWKPPEEILRDADLSQVDEFCDNSEAFTLAGTNVNLFERMQFLRGTENLFMDIGYGVKQFDRLLEILRDYFCRELEMWAKTSVDAIVFFDDWGSQTGMLVAPDWFRTVFKPVYEEFAHIIKKAGKKVFMHSDGCIESILPDIIDIGVDALNAQLFCMDIEKIAKTYKGKLTFWGELDRQKILPFGTPDDVRQAVRRVRSALDDGIGGVIAQMEWGLKVPKQNILAAFEAWEA